MAAQDLLLRVKDGAVRGSVKLKDVEEILSNDDFTSGRGLLTTTEDGVKMTGWVGLVLLFDPGPWVCF